MKRFVTRQHTQRITYFSTAILFCMLTYNGLYAKEPIVNHNVSSYKTASQQTDNEITLSSNPVSNMKLTSASITATINDPESIMTERGVVWSTTPGVTIANNKTIEGGLGNGVFTTNISGLDRSSTIYFRAYYIDEDGTNLTDEASFSNVPVFSGAGNWDNAALWNVQEVPGNVYGDSPVINGICTIANSSVGGSWICNNLTINSGAILTINTNQVLNVKGTIINNANQSGLVINSDGTLPNGTLTYAYGTPMATVKMYSKASWDLNQAVGSKYSWQFFGIPVKTFSNTFTNCLVRQYNETSIDDAGLWINQDANTPMTSGTGYEIVQQSPISYQFTGLLTNDDFTRTLVYTSNAEYPGQYILGNPYTAAINIKLIQFDANTEQSVYLYNTGSYNKWLDNGGANSGTTSAAGQYTVSTPSTAGVSGIPSQIPSMQGFLVKTKDQPVPVNGSITIPYNSAVINNTDLQRAPGINKSVGSEKVVTRIDLSGTHYADCMWLFTDPSCTSKFDNGWDGYKITGALGNPQLFAMESDGNYQIDAVADVNETNLGFNAGQETDYKLTFTHQNTDKVYTGLYLVDLLENKTTDITASGSEYSFSAVSTPTPVNRFKIVTSPTINTNTLQVSSNLKIFNSKGTLYIQNQSNQNGNLVLYNMDGKAVKKIEFKANEITTFSTVNFIPGAYVAKANTNLEMVAGKIIIR